MRFSRAQSVTLIGGLVLSGCGTVLLVPDDELPERNRDATDPAAANAATSPPSSTDPSNTTIPIDADAGSDAGSKKKNGEACVSDAECESATCFVGGKSAHYCTIACANEGKEDPACEALGAPFNGDCSKDGFCKR